MASTGRLNELAMQCRQDSLFWFPAVANDLGFMALAYAGEVGEYCNLIKKIERGSLSYKDASTRVALASELTDGFIYMLNNAALLNVDLEKSYEGVRARNARRFKING
jgi:NTP pyrophosphatase (non-canonical NTP hydrolase)